VNSLISRSEPPRHDVDQFQGDSRVAFQDLLESIPVNDQDAAWRMRLGSLRVDVIPLPGKRSKEFPRSEQVKQDLLAGQGMLQ